MVGLLTRLAAFFSAFLMLMFYFGNWDLEHGFINADFMYLLVFLSVAAFGAGRILGLDAVVEQYEIDGRAQPIPSVGIHSRLKVIFNAKKRCSNSGVRRSAGSA